MQKVVARESKHGLRKNTVYEMEQDNGKVLFRGKRKIIALTMDLVSRLKIEEYEPE